MNRYPATVNLLGSRFQIHGVSNIKAPIVLPVSGTSTGKPEGIHLTLLEAKEGSLHSQLTDRTLDALENILPHPMKKSSLRILTLKTDQTVDLEALLQNLLALGYERDTTANTPGVFAKRGGILDIFPAGLKNPVRLELNNDKIIQLFSFDLANQKRLAEFTTLTVLPIELSHSQEKIAFLASLAPGDYAVHLDHGVGKFIGMVVQRVDELPREYFALEYAEGDMLYVPIEAAEKLDKYLGAAHPNLHRLSGAAWWQITQKIKEDAKKFAEDLLRIHAARAVANVRPLAPRPEEAELAASFPFEETPDQTRAIAEVLHDLEQAEPMDRLICGDVGFGKTEIAVRAALRVALNREQAALLCPTTILAQQHFDTFSKRLKNFPVRLELLSRFQSATEQKQIIERIKKGTADIIIATHRLLSADVKFAKLGLVIIDEEQRFGVKQKEKLKNLRAETHFLTLSATPIPRTLNLALSGLRPISVIETPPVGRLPIETIIEPFSESLVLEAISRELQRGGQVYYLHNKVETINGVAKRLQLLLNRDPKTVNPGSRFQVNGSHQIAILHGQLPEKTIAEVMHDFDAGKIDVLVCSTIIENGLDLPNVNTLIVENATDYGLSQLYQIRGRIGRGLRQGRALLLYDRQKLEGLAKARLSALEEARELGSGFEIARRDLEIRGVGGILSRAQHGQVKTIGLSLYARLLEQAVQEIKTGQPSPTISEVTLNLPLSYGLPTSYIENETDRLKWYQRLSRASDLATLAQERRRLFKRYPQISATAQTEVNNLFYILELRMLAGAARISMVTVETLKSPSDDKRLRLVLESNYDFDLAKLGRLLEKNYHWQIGKKKLRLEEEWFTTDWQTELKETITILAN